MLAISAGAALALAIGFFALFFPPMRDLPGLLAWCGATLALSYLSYSVLSIVHQSWGARLGGDAPQRARIVSWREGLSLLGVLLASVLSSTLGPAVTARCWHCRWPWAWWRCVMRRALRPAWHRRRPRRCVWR